MDKPFFSIIMPVHNKAPYIRRSIGSVMSQAFQDFELLLVDDASTDDSLIEMQSFTDPRIRILHRDRPGAGGYAARNLGIREARADWVAFLDADDEWLPEHLDVLRSFAGEPEAQMLATGWLDKHGQSDPEPNAFSKNKVGLAPFRLTFLEYLRAASQKRTPVWTGAVVVRRDTMLAVGGFPEACRRGGDTVAWLRILHHVGALHLSPCCTAIYHRDASTVIRYTPAEVQGNCIYEACKELAQGCRDRSTRRLLMRFSNLHVLYGLKARAISGALRFSDCSQHYARVDWKTHFFYRVHSLAPGRAQRWLWGFYQGSKRTLPLVRPGA